MIGDDHTPSQGEIAAWLAGRAPEQHRQSWADALAGLPWRYIRPLVRISDATGVHPIGVMGVAARYSDDAGFVQAAQAQLRRLEVIP